MRPFAPTVCIKLLTCEIRTSYGGNIKGAVASTSTNLAAARPATRIEPDAGGYVAAMTNAFGVVWSTAAIGRKRQDDFACALSAAHLFPLLTPAAEMVVGRFSSLIGRSGSSAFRLSTAVVSMSLAGSCFSSDSAPRPFHHGSRGQGGTIFRAALPPE